VTDGGGRVPVAAEVTALEGHIGRDDDLMAARWSEDGAVVADAKTERAGASGSDGGSLANALDPSKLASGRRL
jgi:hypothetical protein